MDAKLVEQGKARLAQMKQAAEDLTEALGLPREATYDVLAMMHGEKPSLLGIPQGAAQPQTSDDTLKTRIFQLSEDFLSTQMKEQVTTFRTLWERLKVLPLEALGMGIGSQPSPSTGLGFADNQQLFPVISVISWAVVNWPSFKTDTPKQIQTIILREAQARGCSRAVSSALALYLQPRFMDS